MTEELKKCKICDDNQIYGHLALHLRYTHKLDKQGAQNYYDKYIKKDESEGFCKNCGKAVLFKGLTKGYRQYCSSICSNRSDITKAKAKQTSLKNWGTENPMQSEKIQDKVKSTMVDRYGYDNAARVPEVQEKIRKTVKEKYDVDHISQSKEVKEKVKQTNLERYGHESAMQSEEVKDKVKKTNQERYGTDWVVQSEEFKDKRKSTMLERYDVEHALQSEDFKEKSRKTSIEKYGTQSPAQSDEVKQKTIETNRERHGVDYTFQSKEFKEKAKQTNLERYGVENPMQSKEIQDKVKQTNFEKYGFENAAQSPEIQKKMRDTTQERYGVDHNFKIPEFRENLKKLNLEKYGYECNLSSPEFREKIKKINLEKYGTEFPQQTPGVKEKAANTMLRYTEEMRAKGYIPIMEVSEEYGSGWYLQKIVPIENYKTRAYVHEDYIPTIKEYSERNPFKSHFEQEVGDFVESLGINIQRNNRSLISPLEIDIYIPEKDLAIECNGIYWHSTNAGTLTNYHLNKTNLCLEEGIRLIHINEWEWIYKQDIIKSLIKSALGIFQRRIYARNCEVKELSAREAREFLENNHLQSYVNSSIRLGLFYKDELVQVITLGKSRFKENEFELLRMATALDTQVIGGFSKLISHIPKDIKEIVSYVDRSKFTGKGYINSGWKLINITDPGYSYFRNSEKLNRIAAQKHKLADLLGKENFDPNLTEAENMMINGYYQVYDCGNLKVKLIRS